MKSKLVFLALVCSISSACAIEFEALLPQSVYQPVENEYRDNQVHTNIFNFCKAFVGLYNQWSQERSSWSNYLWSNVIASKSEYYDRYRYAGKAELLHFDCNSLLKSKDAIETTIEQNQEPTHASLQSFKKNVQSTLNRLDTFSKAERTTCVPARPLHISYSGNKHALSQSDELIALMRKHATRRM